jgi:hypothetical protein
MFDSFSRGYGFIRQAVAMARADRDLVKPSLMLVGVSLLITLASLVPMALVAIAVPGDFGQTLLGILGALLIFVQYVVSYFFSGLTIALIHGYLTKGDGRLDEASAAVRRNIGSIVALALVSTVVKLVENAARNRKNPIGAVLAGLLEAVWTTATFFILPAMIIEDLAFAPAVKRSAYLIKNNLLLVGVSYIGVGLVLGLFNFVIFLAALAIGIALFAAFSAIHLVAGVAAAVIVVGTAVALLSAASSYLNTAYYTSLFLWARDVERGTQQGLAPQQVQAPAPLAAVLG